MDIGDLITDAVRNGYDVTVKVTRRKDTLSGDLTLPLEWARALKVHYDLMSDPALARVSKRKR